MAKKRHHSSMRNSSVNNYRDNYRDSYRDSYSVVDHHSDKFNDEWRHDKDPYKMGPYIYDRQETDPRSLDRSARVGRSMNGYDNRRDASDSRNYPNSGSPYGYERDRSEYDRTPFNNSGEMRGYYEGYDNRRGQEMRDAGMIHEDHRAVANLPQHVEYRPYPVNHNYMPEDLDDTIRGVDRQIQYDDAQRNAHFYPKKV